MSDDEQTEEWWTNEGKQVDRLGDPDAISHPTDRTESEPEIATRTPADARADHFVQSVLGEVDRTRVGNVLYAWQMEVDGAWNIIGAVAPTGQVLPLVTTSVRVAWEAIEVAQAHANRNQCQVRLMAFSAGDVMAVVVPND